MKSKLLIFFLHRPVFTGPGLVVARLLLTISLIPALSAETLAQAGPSSQGQVPQGFNYQAVARNVLGNPIPDTPMPVRITIQSDSTGGTIFWQELHSPVTTSSIGVINIIIGKGVKEAGTYAKFSDIDWSVSPKFIKTEIDYNGWKEMGVSRFWSVPYALVAGDLEGNLKKLTVNGDTDQPDDILFEVKNKDGQTVFAVYNEGVRVYVSDGAKGLKGGFAVGGFGTDKASSQSYFIVNPDSIRAYIGPANGKSSKGGFAVGGFDQTKAPVEEYFRITRDSARILINQSAKKPKGGFAVGGFDPTKGNAMPFLNLTPNNYFIGHESGVNIDTGLYNSFIGYQAGKGTIGGNSNIFIGYQSGFSNKVGSDNTFLGYQAGYSSIGNTAPGVFQHGDYNCYLGYKAGYASLYGDFNTLVGYQSGMNNQGSLNTFMGYCSGLFNTQGMYNTFIGVSAGQSNTEGGHNVFMGHQSGYSNSDGEGNVYIGTVSGAYFSSGNKNVIIGDGAGAGTVYGGNGTGSNNVIIGSEAGKSAKDGSSNIFIGNQAGISETGSDKLIIHNNSSGTPLIYGKFDTGIFRINGNVEATGTIATVSDSSLKKNVTVLHDVLKNIKRIDGVYFDWADTENSGLFLREGRQVGVIAQEVERVYPELVVANDLGYKMVDYTRLSAVLLQGIKEQQQQIDSQQKEIEELKTLVNRLIVNQTAGIRVE